MMELNAQTMDFNRQLVKFMRDNPDAYISIKANGWAQLMFEEEINDEKDVAIMEEDRSSRKT